MNIARSGAIALLTIAIAACAASSPSDEVTGVKTASPAAKPTPAATPASAAKPTPEPASNLTAEQRNAIEKAKDYLDYSSFSRSGLINQLVYEGFTNAAATFAVDTLDVDWTKQAYLKAKQYLDYSSFSLKGLIEQLEYEGFTPAQAKAGGTKAYNE